MRRSNAERFGLAQLLRGRVGRGAAGIPGHAAVRPLLRFADLETDAAIAEDARDARSGCRPSIPTRSRPTWRAGCAVADFLRT